MAGGAPCALEQATGLQEAARRAALGRLAEALDVLGVTWHPAPGGKLVLSLWPGLHAGISLDGQRYGWTERDLLVTWLAGDVAGAAHLIAERLRRLAGGWPA